VALATASLFVRSLVRTLGVDPGFDARRLATLSVSLGTSGYDEGRGRQFQRRLIERASTVPGVETAALADFVPLIGGGLGRTVYLKGQARSDPRNGKMVQLQDVSPGYFRTMGVQILRGRGVLDSDQPATPRVVVVNETMARTFWPGKDPIGEVIWFHGSDEPNEVVGIARDSDYNNVAEERQPFIYTALNQVYSHDVSLIVRSARPASVLGAVQRAVQELDRELPLLFVTTMDDAIRQSLFLQRFGAGLLGFFGGLAFVLALVGVYGVMAYSVSRRTRELGIRVALGASRPTMVRDVLWEGGRLALVGVLVGVPVSQLLARVVSSLLYGVGVADPVTFIGVPASLVLAALAASYLPARRASTINPIVALRSE
jgi:putative ABC transport system permease protein